MPCHDPESYKPSKSRPFEDSLFAPVDDICRNRHKGNPESEQANKRVHSAKADLHAAIYAIALRRGSEGITLKEVEAELNLLRNTVSARLSELKEKGLLQKRGDTRDNCAVLIPRFAEIG